MSSMKMVTMHLMNIVLLFKLFKFQLLVMKEIHVMKTCLYVQILLLMKK